MSENPRACERCGISDEDPTAEIWSWTDSKGVERVRCKLHLLRSRWNTVRKAPSAPSGTLEP